jgi:hypothetical protein
VLIAAATRSVRRVLSYGVRDLIWLIYVIGISSYIHRAAGPFHQLARWRVRHRRRRDLENRMILLRKRVANGLWTQRQRGRRVSVAELSPKLEQICRTLRRPEAETVLASIDQDGFLQPRFAHFWAAPCVDAGSFLPRARFELLVVDRDGWIGVRKGFRGNKVAFVNELEAALDLASVCSHVAEILGIDFEKLSITFAYIPGQIVREALAEAGAPMRDRDVHRGSVRSARTIEQRRRAAGRQLINKVLDPKTIAGVGEALISIHRAGYIWGDIKYGNVIIEAVTKTPYFIDYERALPLRYFSRNTATYLRDRDAEKLNEIFGTNLLTAELLRQLSFGHVLYSPFSVGNGLWWGAIWNPDAGVLRWRRLLSKHLPMPHGGRVLDLGANNGFNALQMLRSGVGEVIGIEIDAATIEEGLFLKRIFEWADNREYRLFYIQGSNADIVSMNLGRFDMVTALCTLYYSDDRTMRKIVSDLAQLTDTLVLQCNNDRSIDRSDPSVYEKASLPFNIALVRENGFPNVTVIERRGSTQPLVIARTG